MKLGRKIGKQLLFGIFTYSMVLSSAITSHAYTADTPVCQTVTTSTEDCVLIGVKGDYITQAQEALDRINAIRLEACKEGVWDPRDNTRKLTEADYKPLKWSAGLEMIARIRAAEASLTISHTRPNGGGCFTLAANGISNSGEVLAWNYSSSMIPGIEQWYAEKAAWVDQDTTKVTGHYEIMINPKNTYVGLGCMVTDYRIYPNTTCGRFSSTSVSLDVAMDEAVTDCIQLVEAKKSSLTNATLTKVSNNPVDSLKIGDTISYELIVGTNMEKRTLKALLMDNVKWTSSDDDVATVDNYGNVTGVDVGTVTITATSDSGFTDSVSLTFTCGHDDTEYRNKKEPTCTEGGYTGDKYCRTCGEKVTSGSDIKAIGRQWDDGKVRQPATAVTDGEMLYTCQMCGITRTETIPATGESTQNPDDGDDGGNTGGTESGNGSDSGNTGGTESGSGSDSGSIGNTGGSGNENVNDDNNDKVNTGDTTSGNTNTTTNNNTNNTNNNNSATDTNTGNNQTDKDKTDNKAVKIPSVSKVKSLKAKAGSKKLTITWKKVSGAAGYQLQVSTKSNCKGAKTVKISKSKKQYVAKKLKAKKKYYVRIRAYKTYKDAKGKTQKAYGKWVKVSKKTK